MKHIEDDYLAAIKDLTSKKAGNDVAFFSSLLGRRNDAKSFTPSYWVENLTKPVLFCTASKALYAECKPDVIEIGPLRSNTAQGTGQARLVWSNRTLRSQPATDLMVIVVG